MSEESKNMKSFSIKFINWIFDKIMDSADIYNLNISDYIRFSATIDYFPDEVLKNINTFLDECYSGVNQEELNKIKPKGVFQALYKKNFEDIERLRILEKKIKKLKSKVFLLNNILFDDLKKILNMEQIPLDEINNFIAYIDTIQKTFDKINNKEININIYDKIEMVNEMFLDNLPVEKMMKYTNLTKEEIEEIIRIINSGEIYWANLTKIDIK